MPLGWEQVFDVGPCAKPQTSHLTSHNNSQRLADALLHWQQHTKSFQPAEKVTFCAVHLLTERCRAKPQKRARQKTKREGHEDKETVQRKGHSTPAIRFRAHAPKERMPAATGATGLPNDGRASACTVLQTMPTDMSQSVVTSPTLTAAHGYCITPVC